MIIQTLGEQYHVIKYSFSDSNEERFIGKREDDGKEYTIVRIKNRVWIAKTVEFLMEQTKNRYFTDFVSCFMSEDYLHVVMKYANGVSLKEKLEKERCTLEERMVIGKSVLERIMVLKMPDYFLQDCLKEENIILGDGLCVNFQYALLNFNTYHAIDFAQVQERLCQVFCALFSEERKRNVLLELEQFCNSLQAKNYKDIVAIYTAYDKLCKVIRVVDADKKTVPWTWEFRIWDKMKQLIPGIKKCLAVVFMILAIVFLLYEIREAFEDGKESRIVEAIGELEIKETEETVDQTGQER